MTSLQQIKEWSEKYPFDEGELEIILRCWNSISNPTQGEDKVSFLNLLAHSFPYVFFFLPRDEIQNRISLVENHILPQGFGEKFKKAIFPIKGTESEAEATEILINGVANCCKGDSKNTLGVIFDCCKRCDETADPEDIVQLCYHLSIAAQVLVSPRINKPRILAVGKQNIDLHGLTNSLSNMMASKARGSHHSKTRVTRQVCLDWGTKCVPHIGSTLSGFVHDLVFHGKSTHSRVSPFSNPELLDSSQIFTDEHNDSLFAISCMAPDLGGKWRRLFSSDQNGSSTSTLEKAMAQHVGPSIFVIKVDSDRLLGGVAESGWKFGYFLFEIKPLTRIHHSKGDAAKYFIRHNVEQTTDHGESLVGTAFFANGGVVPELFFSAHIHWCKALFLDVPFSSKVQAFEVWGIEELMAGQSLKKVEVAGKGVDRHPQ